MSSKPIRFAVAEDGESHSTVWRLWASRSELYLAGRSHAGILMISFHKNGPSAGEDGFGKLAGGYRSPLRLRRLAQGPVALDHHRPGARTVADGQA
jgi:hypothetical protein